MKIKSAEYVMSEVSVARFPQDGKFEVVLVGKSNVGKSSFINSMLGRNGLARTSSQPGKTRTANFYLVNDAFYFVDMPGYGYAKVSKNLKQEFDQILKDYLKKRETDFVVCFLVDHRHPPTENDLRMLDFLEENGIHPVLILTKADKVKNSQKAKIRREILNAFDMDETDAVFAYSVQQKETSEAVWGFLCALMDESED